MNDNTTPRGGMKEKELRKLAKCSGCERLILRTGSILFWKVTLERHGLDMQAIKRQTGMGLFLGSAMLAQAMGADEDMTKIVGEEVTIALCDHCACNQVVPMLLHARAAEQLEKAEVAK